MSPSEEIDLTVKWFGKDSSEHALRIRAVNAHQPSIGLKAIWSRLDRMCGSPTAIENALFSRVETFPKIQTEDIHELSSRFLDLQELELVKHDVQLRRLTYLDTARGVQPILEELPHLIPEPWMSQSFKYERDYSIFPPHNFYTSKNVRAVKLK